MPPNLMPWAPRSQVEELLSENDDWSRSRKVFWRWSRMSAGRLAPEKRNEGNPGAAAASGGIWMPSVCVMSPATKWLFRLRVSAL